MSYNIYFNGKLVSTEASVMDAMYFINGNGLMIINEIENLEIGNCYVDLICVEA